MCKLTECPNCKTPWQRTETITEYFFRYYTSHGVSQYKLDKGLNTPEEAAADSALNFGCTPDSPKHFGKNVVVVQSQHSLEKDMLECQNCFKKFFD